MGHEDQRCDDAQDAEEARRPNGLELSFVHSEVSDLWKGSATGLAGAWVSGPGYRFGPDLPTPYEAASGNELLTTFATPFDLVTTSGVSPPSTEQEALVTILDPKTGQLVIINLPSKPRRK